MHVRNTNANFIQLIQLYKTVAETQKRLNSYMQGGILAVKKWRQLSELIQVYFDTILKKLNVNFLTKW